jgi:hypothetical protein
MDIVVKSDLTLNIFLRVEQTFSIPLYRQLRYELNADVVMWAMMVGGWMIRAQGALVTCEHTCFII